MGPNSDDHADPADRHAALRRRILGLGLGGVLSAAIGWGLHGGWQWFRLLGVPIRSGPGSFPLTSVIAYGLAGIVWGGDGCLASEVAAISSGARGQDNYLDRASARPVARRGRNDTG